MHYRGGGAFASYAEIWMFESQTYVVTPRTKSSKQEVTSPLQRKW